MSSSAQALPSNPADHAGPRILGATLTTTCLAFLLVATRFYVRSFIIRARGWDDYVMLLALCVSITGQALVIAQVLNGGGRHIGDVDPEVYMAGMHYNFASQPVYLWAICIVKLAVGSSLLRIASEKRYKVLIYSIMGFMLFYTFGCFMTIMLQCRQLSALWNPAVPRRCWDKKTLQALSFTNVALNILTDFTFAVLIPVPMLRRLQLNNRTKLSVIGILALGLFACAAAIVKLPSLVNYGQVGDFLWDSRDITIWTVTECNIGIIAGSMAALKPLFKPILGSTYVRGFTKRYGYGEGYGNRYGTTSGRHPEINPKNFVSIGSDKDRDEDFEAQSRASQRYLVSGNSVGLGVIEKTTVTTFETEVSTPSTAPHPWNVGGAR